MLRNTKDKELRGLSEYFIAFTLAAFLTHIGGFAPHFVYVPAAFAVYWGIRLIMHLEKQARNGKQGVAKTQDAIQERRREKRDDRM